MAYVLKTAALKQCRQLLPKRLVITARSPPIPVSPGAPVAVIKRVRRIDRGGCPPIGILVDQPTTRTQALRHLPDRLLLPAHEMKQHQPRADEIERTRAQHFERVLEDAVLRHLKMGRSSRSR
jgi:hypothetical protein